MLLHKTSGSFDIYFYPVVIYLLYNKKDYFLYYILLYPYTTGKHRYFCNGTLLSLLSATSTR